MSISTFERNATIAEMAVEIDRRGAVIERLEAERDALKAAHPWPEGPFAFGDRVEKAKGSSWHGQVCGWYTTSLTPIGYCVESEREPGSVQLYPAAALAPATSGEG